ncbi:MAG: phage portal protein [Saccharofermentans sp.]|jgi:hypothetical protein|nr:phage portal protein [Saccharofermentans sp.]
MGAVKEMIKRWLDIKPAENQRITIDADMSHQDACFEYNLWYRGSASELDQFYKSLTTVHDDVVRAKFWAAVPSRGNRLRKIHSGLPGLMVDMLTSIVITDLNAIEVTDPDVWNDTWQEISEDNNFVDTVSQAIGDVLVQGDGAWKISFDKDISDYPIIEFYPADRVKFEKKRGRINKIIFNTRYYVEATRKVYYLEEHYTKGMIEYHLFDENGNEVSLDSVPDLKGLKTITWEDDFVMALPMMFYKSAKFPGRGRSIFDRKTDAFDAFDEAISQWQDALRIGRVKTYIPETMIPRDPNTGKAMEPNAFDNQFIALKSSMSENSKDTITVEAPHIDYDGLLATYINTLDMCLQGIISPSTLGIDVKKLDNAEAQREKEKATLYTRDTIIDTLNDVLPELVKNVLAVYATLYDMGIEDTDVAVTFGEYANPSFEAQVETLGKAASSNLMSTETQVEELWGDTKDEEWKKAEVERIKAEKGIADGGIEPPAPEEYAV